MLGLAAILTCAGGRRALADVLIGPNGERLPGHVVEEKDGFVTFQSDFLGRVRVRSDQARIERDSPPVSAPDQPVAPAVGPGAAPRWSSDLAVKLGQDRGSLKTPEDTLDGSWKVSRESTDGQLVSTLNYKYKRTAGVLEDDNWLGSLSYDRFLSADRFMTARALGVSDLTSEGYDETGTFAVAAGWRLWEEPGKYVRIGPALGYLMLKRGGQTFDGAAIGFYARTLYPIWGGAMLEGELQSLNASAGSRYTIMQLRLKRPLTERLYVAVDWIYSLSHVEIESGIKSEWRWVLGWSFDPRKQP